MKANRLNRKINKSKKKNIRKTKRTKKSKLSFLNFVQSGSAVPGDWAMFSSEENIKSFKDSSKANKPDKKYSLHPVYPVCGSEGCVFLTDGDRLTAKELFSNDSEDFNYLHLAIEKQKESFE